MAATTEPSSEQDNKPVGLSVRILRCRECARMRAHTHKHRYTHINMQMHAHADADACADWCTGHSLILGLLVCIRCPCRWRYRWSK
jgi:hypothetical protein